jgi:tetratricopeptide (TPR) repeat protein
MAEKAVDFLSSTKGDHDPMALYIKGVLAMEKLQRREAIRYLKDANTLTEFTNHEIVRAFGVAQYRYGNREKGMYLLEVAYDINPLDAEIIYNIIELSLLERNMTKARDMIRYYQNHRNELATFDKTIAYYDEKITLFDEYLSSGISIKKTKTPTK